MLKHLIDKVIIEDTVKLVAVEKKTTAEILKYLEEIDRRKLYADYGYPSLIKFCVHHLKYPNSTYQRDTLVKENLIGSTVVKNFSRP